MNNELFNALNEQFNFEIHSSHIYLNIATYFESIGLKGFAHFFMVQFEEETFHATKQMNYMSSRGLRPYIVALEAPLVDFENPLQAIEIALTHEKEVSSRLVSIMKLARLNDDYATEAVLQWFINEQVEEEATFDDLFSKVKLVKDSGLYLLDKELSTRLFTPPAQSN